MPVTEGTSPPGTVLHPKQKPVHLGQETKKGRDLDLVSSWVAAVMMALAMGCVKVAMMEQLQRKTGSWALEVNPYYYSKCGPWASSIDMTWAWALSQTC